mgnify:FL=1
MSEKQHETEKELKQLVLMGTCPCCSSVRIKYREYITNRTFGFECFNCGWNSQYNLTELKIASINWFSSSH